MLVSGVQQSDSVINIPVTIFFTNSFPIYAITEYGADFPMPHKSLLVIYCKYSSVYMSILTSQFISLHHLSPLDICPGGGLLNHMVALNLPAMQEAWV